MKRNDEAVLSQTIITLNKSIFVEGLLDYKLFKDFLKSQSISNVKVIEINEFIDDSDKPVAEREIAKEKVKSLIKKCNAEEKISNKYLGIVDLDYDYFRNSVEQIENLMYTDFHCVESYFLDVKLINIFLEENGIEELTSEDFSRWIDNSLIFSSYFYFQLLNLNSIHADDHLSFSGLNICNPNFIDYQKKRILLKQILRAKTKNYPSTIPLFITFIKGLDRNNYRSVKLLFLHGKHTLAFIVGLLKGMFQSLRNIRDEHIVHFLKDKFLLFKFYKDSRLFENILKFSQA